MNATEEKVRISSEKGSRLLIFRDEYFRNNGSICKRCEGKSMGIYNIFYHFRIVYRRFAQHMLTCSMRIDQKHTVFSLKRSFFCLFRGTIVKREKIDLDFVSISFIDFLATV